MQNIEHEWNSRFGQNGLLQNVENYLILVIKLTEDTTNNVFN